MLDLFPQEKLCGLKLIFLLNLLNATFEDIPLKQAYDELMVVSKKDYRRTVAFHKGHY